MTTARSIRETRALVNAFLDKAVAARVINQKSNVSPLLDRLRLSSPRLTRRGLPLSRAERVPTRGRESFDVHTASPPPPRRAIVRPRPLVVGSRPSRRPRALLIRRNFSTPPARVAPPTPSLSTPSLEFVPPNRPPAPLSVTLAPCAARHRRSSSVVSRNIQPIKRPSLARVSPPPRLHRAARTSGRGRHRSRATRLRRLHRARRRHRHRRHRHRRRHRARRAVIASSTLITHHARLDRLSLSEMGKDKERVVASRDSSHDGKEEHPAGGLFGKRMV